MQNTFSKRVALKKEFLDWAHENQVVDSVFNVITWLLSVKGYVNPKETIIHNEVTFHKEEDCQYYTLQTLYKIPGCLATKEIDPCKGTDCGYWEMKE